MTRRSIELDNRQVHDFLNGYSEDELRQKHPKIADIIGDTIALQLPRKLSCSTLLRVL